MSFVIVRNKQEVKDVAQILGSKEKFFYWISISSATYSTALRYKIPPNCLSFTRFIFDDVSDTDKDFKPFDEVMASQVISLFNSFDKSYPLLINCDAGISRSAAFASVYHDFILKSADPNWFEMPPYHPNSHVKRLLKRLLYEV